MPAAVQTIAVPEVRRTVCSLGAHMPLRVVLLTKPYPLAEVLERRIAATGCLAGVVHETPPGGWRGARREVKRLVKRAGVLRACDVVAYQVYQRLFRMEELYREMGALGAAHPAPPVAPSLPRRSFTTLNGADAQTAIRTLTPDLMIVHGTGILKAETFGLAPLTVNLHCGVLPEYRGHDSTFWALHAGDVDQVGASLHVIDAGVDTGKLIAVARVPCTPGESDLRAWMSAFSAGVDLAVELVEALRNGLPVQFQPPLGRPGPHYGRKGLTDYLAYARRRRQVSARQAASTSSCAEQAAAAAAPRRAPHSTPG